MDEGKNISFSDNFLDFAYKALVLNGAKSDEERKMLLVISSVTEKHGISFRKYMEMINEINNELAKLRQGGEDELT